jgi:hypothetical protein
MTGGAGWSVRERGEEGVGLVRGGLGRLVSGAAQVTAGFFLLYFFCSAFFFFYFRFLFWVLKRLFYSDLNKTKLTTFGL